MGSHRASIKIEMEFHGVKDKADMWINYWPADCCGMDKRVIEFFTKVYNEGMEKWNEENEKHDKKYKAEQLELAERKELARLKDKYKFLPPSPIGRTQGTERKDMRSRYMHTIDGRPATYIKNQQICFAGIKTPIRLCSSKKVLKNQQRISSEWRKKQGFSDRDDYGYKRVIA